MLKTHRKLFFVSAICVLAVLTVLQAKHLNKAEASIKIKHFPVLMGDVSYENKLLSSFTGTQKQKVSIKILQFPVLAINHSDIKTAQNFQVERFFSRIHALKTKPKVLISKIKANIIRISNMPVNRGFLSSQFGIRKDPFHGSARMHKGVDIAAREGSIVSPLGDGKIIYAGHKAGYGNMVEIQHSKTVVTRYAHLKQHLVNVGQQVTIKDQIGLVGQTGRSTGPHLHLEVLFNGEQSDPQVYLANHFGSRSKTQVAFVERKVETFATKSVTETVAKRVEKRVETKPTVLAKAKPKAEPIVIAKVKPKTIAKQKPAAKTMTIQVANNESKQVRDYPQVSYQDYVNSVDGMFGLSAPDSFSR